MLEKRLLRVSWTPRKSNQSILKEISPEYSLEVLMLKLKLQYFGHLMWIIDSFEKTLILGKIEAEREGDNRGWDGWMASLAQWTWIWVNSGIWWSQGGLACCSPWDRKELDTTVTERSHYWTERSSGFPYFIYFWILPISVPQSAPGLVFADCIDLLHLWLQRI